LDFLCKFPVLGRKLLLRCTRKEEKCIFIRSDDFFLWNALAAYVPGAQLLAGAIAGPSKGD
jgi:hypothetical protein